MNIQNTVILLMLLFFFLFSPGLFSQTNQKYYIGISYGKSFPLGDFKDTNTTNKNAGFAETGTKLDLYGGYRLNKKLTLIGMFRLLNHQSNTTKLINDLRSNNPEVSFTNNSDNWAIFYILTGLAYQIDIFKTIKVFPRLSIGPMILNSPTISITAFNENSTIGYIRENKSAIGLGYEIGIGLKRDLGKHFTLMPTFTFTGGFIELQSTTKFGEAIIYSEYQPNIITFNLGLSLAYRF